MQLIDFQPGVIRLLLISCYCCSLLAAERPTLVYAEDALHWLLAHRFISWSAEAGAFAATELGRAAAFAGMSPGMALGVQQGTLTTFSHVVLQNPQDLCDRPFYHPMQQCQATLHVEHWK